MVRMISKVAFVAVCALALSMFTQRANASGTDFSCGSGTCTGAVVASGANFSGSGINMVAGPFTLPLPDGSEETGETFVLAFNTSTKAISLTDTDGSTTLTGTIESFIGIGTAVEMRVNWTVPAGYSTPSGFIVVDGSGPVSGCTGSGCAVVSADVNVTPSPEPASLLLLGTGLLGMGAAVRRRLIG